MSLAKAISIGFMSGNRVAAEELSPSGGDHGTHRGDLVGGQVIHDDDLVSATAVAR